MSDDTPTQRFEQPGLSDADDGTKKSRTLVGAGREHVSKTWTITDLSR